MAATQLAAQLDALDAPSRRLVEFTQELIRTPSLSGQEHDVSRLLAAELETLGFRDVTIDAVGNVVGYLGEGPPRLMFNGHIDHVPPAGMKDPYGAELVDAVQFGEEGLAIRGRGSCDMKANVAAGAFAAAFLDADALRGGSFVFTADVQEEPDSPAGIPALLAAGLRADYGISSESTELAISLGHRGKVQFDIVVTGRSSHASTPDDGVNAVFRAQPFVHAVEKLHQRLPDDELFGRATVTVTGISSEPQGDVAVVPSSCTIRVDRRYVPGETPQTVTRELEDLVAEIAAEHGSTATVALVNIYPLMAIDADHPLVAAGAAAVEQVLGRAPSLRTWRFGVNATFMSEAGIPTIGIGPGNEDWAHTPEEHIPVAQLVESSRIYAALIERLCGTTTEEQTR
jgi:putative selenium metabolism hydrolase